MCEPTQAELRLEWATGLFLQRIENCLLIAQNLFLICENRGQRFLILPDLGLILHDGLLIRQDRLLIAENGLLIGHYMIRHGSVSPFDLCSQNNARPLLMISFARRTHPKGEIFLPSCDGGQQRAALSLTGP
jgi:hypothetical protein